MVIFIEHMPLHYKYSATIRKQKYGVVPLPLLKKIPFHLTIEKRINKMSLILSSQPIPVPEEKEKCKCNYLKTIKSGEAHISPHINL